MQKVLFILKARSGYDTWDDVECGKLVINSYQNDVPRKMTGLWNSANYVAKFLNTTKEFEAKVVNTTDGNTIDKEVTEYRPDFVIIEAFWMPPYKLDVLIPRHPKVKAWIIRGHSDLPFLCTESIITGYTFQYLSYGEKVFVSNNKKETNDAMSEMYNAFQGNSRFFKKHNNVKYHRQIPFLPNCYSFCDDCEFPDNGIEQSNNVLNIGIFGAIRPLKNDFQQVVAAALYAKRVGKYINIYMNAGRREGENSNSILKNIQAFCDELYIAGLGKLHEIGWLQLDEFLGLHKNLDLSMGCNFSETFSIVLANAVEMNVPIVGAKTVPWIPSVYTADPSNLESIVSTIDVALRYRWLESIFQFNKRALLNYNKEAEKTWLQFLRSF